MHFSAAVYDLSAAVSACASVSPRKTTMPILTHVLLSAEAGHVHVSATDLDVCLQRECAASVDRAGRVALPAAHFSALLKALPDARVDVKVNGGRCTLTCAGTRFDLVALNADDFPKLPKRLDDGVRVADVGPLLKRVSHSVSTDETRYVLNGALVERRGNVLHVVSTDGHRLTVCTQPDDGPDVKFIVPRKALREAAESASVLAPHDGAMLWFDNGLGARQIEGAFPDWRQVVPKKEDVCVELASADLLDALKRMQIVSDTLHINVDAESVKLSARDSDMGEADETLTAKVEPSAAGRLEIGCNVAYLIDAVRCQASDTVRIGLMDALSPLKVYGHSAECMSVVMPMRI